MIRIIAFTALICAVLASEIAIIQTSHAIEDAEPRDIPTIRDWLVFGGMASDDDGIHFQPFLCALMGTNVSIFAKWHERCHYWNRSGSRQQQEDAADACAARHAPQNVTQEVIAWLRDRNDKGDAVHRASRDRSTLIARASMKVKS